MKSKLFLVCVLFFSLGAAHAEQATAQRPRIGLVLSGGGARGAAHVGVLRVLEELRIPVDYIAGTSMGSAVGGLYASGLSAEELNTIFGKFDWDAAFNDSPPRSERSYRRKQDDQNSLVKYRVGVGADGFKFPRGAVEGQNFVTELRKLGHITQILPSFDELPTPFRALASDIVSGESVVISSGDLAMAIRASVAIAPLFSPVEYQGRLLSDGGYLNNIPVNVARDMGADRLIVVNIGTPLAKRDEIRSVMSVMSATGRLGGQQFDNQQKALVSAKDLLIEPDLQGLSFVDFAKVPEMIKRGESKARDMIEQLKRFSVSEKDYAIWKAHRKGLQAWPVIRAIEVHNYSKIDDSILQPFISQPIGAPLNPIELQQDLGRIYGLGYFEYVDYTVVDSTVGATLVIEAPRKSWGPNYLQFGVKFTDNFNGDSQYLLGSRYTMTELNRMGGEFQSDFGIGTNSRLGLEYYQPFLYGKRRFDKGAAYFVTPVVGAERASEDIISDGNRILQYRVNRYVTGVDLGRQYGNVYELRGGFRKTFATANLQVGTPPPGGTGDTDFGDAYVRAAIKYDTLNKVSFPTHGGIGGIEWRQTVQAMGTSFNYQTLDLSAQHFWPWKKNTFAARGIYSTNLNRETERPRPYNLGGFLFLSGFKENELVGTDRILGQLQYYYEMGKVAKAPWYLGAITESGGTWMGENDISLATTRLSGTLFLGVDSFFGPVYLAYTLASGGDNSAAFLLGTRY